METFEFLIPHAIQTALGWTLIHSFWQIALIGLGLWFLQKLARSKSAAFKYYLGMGSLLLTLICAVATFGTYLSLHEGDRKPISTDQAIDAVFYPVWQGTDNLTPDTPAGLLLTLSTAVEGWIPTLVNFWFFGALLFLIRYASSLAELRSLRQKQHQELAGRWQQSLEALKQRLKLDKTVRLMESLHVSMPITYGTLKPIILIPTSLITQLPPEQLEAIIAHELAHIKRYDYLVNLLQSALEILFFYHPVFWWINKTIREQRENACDDLAIGIGTRPTDLAHGLANVLNHAHELNTEMAMAFAKRHHPTLNRIKRIMGFKTSHPHPTPLSTFTMILTLILGATLWVGAHNTTLTQNENKMLDTTLFLSLGDKNETLPIFNTQDRVSMSIERQERATSLRNEASDNDWSISDIQKYSPTDTVSPIPEFDFWVEMPTLELGDVPFPDFQSPPIPSFDIPAFPQPILDSLSVSSQKWGIHLDSIPHFNMGMGISPDSLKQLQQAFKLGQEEWQLHFEKEHKAWTEEFNSKMKAWEKEFQPKMEEFHLKMEAWQKENQPRIKEFQQKMELWQKENEPKMKEFQDKMQLWHEKHQDKLNEKMEKVQQKIDALQEQPGMPTPQE